MSEINNNLYEEDFYLWCKNQARYLRFKQYDRLDLENLAAEIEDLAKTKFKTIKKQLKRLLCHMLKWEHQPTGHCNSWAESIKSAKTIINEELDDSPTLKKKFNELLNDEKAYSRLFIEAKEQAIDETGLSKSNFDFIKADEIYNFLMSSWDNTHD